MCCRVYFRRSYTEWAPKFLTITILYWSWKRRYCHEGRKEEDQRIKRRMRRRSRMLRRRMRRRKTKIWKKEDKKEEENKKKTKDEKKKKKRWRRRKRRKRRMTRRKSKRLVWISCFSHYPSPWLLRFRSLDFFSILPLVEKQAGLDWAPSDSY